jgi:hypothetical protein
LAAATFLGAGRVGKILGSRFVLVGEKRRALDWFRYISGLGVKLFRVRLTVLFEEIKNLRSEVQVSDLRPWKVLDGDYVKVIWTCVWT